MSVYDELMNEAPQSPGVLYKSRYKRPSPSTQLSRDPARQAAFRQAGQNVSVERGIGHSTRASQRTMGGTHQEKEMQRKRFADPMMNRTTRSWKMAGMNPGQGIQRQAAGTTYEGPSLREKVEYLHEFLPLIAGAVGGAARVLGGVAKVGATAGGRVMGAVGRGATAVGRGAAAAGRGAMGAAGRGVTAVGRRMSAMGTAGRGASTAGRGASTAGGGALRRLRATGRGAARVGKAIGREIGSNLPTPGDQEAHAERRQQEKVEYIRSFLESRTTRRKPHRRGDTGRGRNRASKTRMKPYVRNKRRRGGPPPHREEQPKFGTVFPRDTEDAPTTDDSRQKNWK